MGDAGKMLVHSSFASVARSLAADLFVFARPRLAGTALLVLAGAVLEGLGLFLIVPLLTIVTDSTASTGRWG